MVQTIIVYMLTNYPDLLALLLCYLRPTHLLVAKQALIWQLLEVKVFAVGFCRSYVCASTAMFLAE